MADARAAFGVAGRGVDSQGTLNSDMTWLVVATDWIGTGLAFCALGAVTVGVQALSERHDFAALFWFLVCGLLFHVCSSLLGLGDTP